VRRRGHRRMQGNCRQRWSRQKGRCTPGTWWQARRRGALADGGPRRGPAPRIPPVPAPRQRAHQPPARYRIHILTWSILPLESSFLHHSKPAPGKSLTWVKEMPEKEGFFWQVEKSRYRPRARFPRALGPRTGHDTASSCTPKHKAKSLHARQSGVLHITPPLCSHNFL
jgi:hypothetical protein